jgi:hypothetical protein
MSDQVEISVPTQRIANEDAQALRMLYTVQTSGETMEPDNSLLGDLATTLVQSRADGDSLISITPTEGTLLATGREIERKTARHHGNEEWAQRARDRANEIVDTIANLAPEHHQRMCRASGTHLKYDETEIYDLHPEYLAMTGVLPAETFQQSFQTQIEFVADRISNTTPNELESTDGITCDRCSESLAPDLEGVLYLADTELLDDAREDQLYIHRLWCKSCAPVGIRHPYVGAAEFYLQLVFDEEYNYTDINVIQASPRGEGFNWDPSNAWTKLTDDEFDKETFISDTEEADDYFLGPDGVIEEFTQRDIDYRSAINEQGQFHSDKENQEPAKQ